MADANGDGIPDLPITIDGVKTTTKALFPDDAARMDFHTKMQLLKSPTSGEDDGSPSVDDQLFAPVTVKKEAKK